MSNSIRTGFRHYKATDIPIPFTALAQAPASADASTCGWAVNKYQIKGYSSASSVLYEIRLLTCRPFSLCRAFRKASSITKAAPTICAFCA